MPCEELDIVWNNIKAEARALADCEPMLASFYHARYSSTKISAAR
jgi:serine O-acetyltransferase